MKNLLLGSVTALSLILGQALSPVAAEIPETPLFDALSALCGQKFKGKVTKSNESDETWRKSKIVMYVKDCNEREIRIPLSVGEDTSRTWIVTRKGKGPEVTFKHDHRHEDGTPDEITFYGGTSSFYAYVESKNAYIMPFEADEYSQALFLEHGLDDAVKNIWTITIIPGDLLIYSLTRPGREFSLKFNLKKPLKN